MTEETVDQFLARRERELMSSVSVLRNQLGTLEAELAKVQRMRSVLVEPAPPPPSNVLFSPNNLSITELVVASYATRTIKDLIIQALIDGYQHGATTAELKGFMRAGYSRNVDPGSLRTQLHRLKSAGILTHDPSNDTWNFQDGKRSLYARYDHPSSRKANPDLQDDPATDLSVEEILGVKSMPWDQRGQK